MYHYHKEEAPRVLAVLTRILTVFIAAAALVHANPNPSSPGPGDVFIEGQPCTISWDIDRSGAWKTMKIELMTGDNFDMVSLAPIVTVDGTNPNKNTYSYQCPKVKPHSAIYFYQFSTPASSNKSWTGRFTITDGSGKDVAPSESTQKDGTKIPWGKGSLAGGMPIQHISAAGDGSGIGSVASVNASSVSTSATPSSNSTVAPSSVSTATTSESAPTETVVPNTDTNGAVGMSTSSTSNMFAFQTGLGLALAAAGFALLC